MKEKDHKSSQVETVNKYGEWEVAHRDDRYILFDAYGEGTHTRMNLPAELVLALAKALDFMQVSNEDFFSMTDPVLSMTNLIKKVRKLSSDSTSENNYFHEFVKFIPELWPHRDGKMTPADPIEEEWSEVKNGLVVIYGDWKVHVKDETYRLVDKKEERTHGHLGLTKEFAMMLAARLFNMDVSFEDYKALSTQAAPFREIIKETWLEGNEESFNGAIGVLFTKKISDSWPHLVADDKPRNEYHHPTEKTITEINLLKKAEKALVGKTVDLVRYLDHAEMEEMQWYERSLVIQFTDGSIFYPAMDVEANGPGALLGQGPPPKRDIIEFPPI